MELPKGTILKVLERFNIQYKVFANTIKVYCPFHPDEEPSASVNIERNTFLCFVCQDKLYRKYQKITKTKGKPKIALSTKALFILLGGNEKEWKDFVREVFKNKNEIVSKIDAETRNKKIKNKNDKKNDFKSIWNGLITKHDAKVKEYLHSRKIYYENLIRENIIKVIDTTVHLAYKNYPIAIPVFDLNKNMIGIQLRTIKNNIKPKTIMIKGSKTGYFGIDRYDPTYPITFFVEGSSDFLTLASWSFKNVIAPTSASIEINSDIARYTSKVAFVFYDFDEKGINLFKRIKENILKENPDCKVIPIGFDLKYKMDLNDFAMLHDDPRCQLVDILNKKLKVIKNENKKLLNKGVLV